MRGVRRLGAVLCAGVLVAAPSACRTPLPPATQPFTLTPEAEFRSRPPAPWEQQDPLAGIEIQELRLANGLTVYLVERTDVPLVSIAYVNRAAELESGARPGLATLTARFLLEDTILDDGVRYAAVQVGGVRPAASVSYSGTVVYLTLVSAGARLALETLAAVVKRPVFEPQRLNETRLSIANELFDESSNRLRLGDLLTVQAALGAEHRWSATQKAQLDSLYALEVKDVQAYYERRYRPEQSALVVVGDVSRSEIEPILERSFGSWQPPAIEPQPAVAPEKPGAVAAAGSQRQIYTLLAGGAQAYIVLPQPAVGRAHPDHVPLQLLARVLAGGFVSRANLALRHDRGITYGVSTDFVGTAHEAYLRIRLAVPQDRLREGILQLDGLLERLQREPVSEAELAAARTSYLARLASATSTHARTASLVANLFLNGRSPSELRDLEQEIRAASPADLQRVAQKYLRPRGDVVVLADHYRYPTQLNGVGRTLLFDKR
jgi:predicted Zn-dependent peptidase